jgi:hypothetical protein
VRVRIVALVLLLAAACSNSPSTAPTVPTTAVEDSVAPAPPAPTTPTTFTTVPGRPRTTLAEPVEILGGGARIGGNVIGPQGNVVGATVRVERLINDQVATMDLSASSGSFTLAGVRGGAYRVRAWKQPDLLLLEPEVFFLAADETKTLDLRVDKVSDVNIRTTLDPATPPAQDPYSVTVLLFAGAVGNDGTLQAIPRPQTPTQLVVGMGLTVVGSDRATTDSGGRARFQVRCLTGGPVTADLLVSTFRLGLGLPNCPGG